LNLTRNENGNDKGQEHEYKEQAGDYRSGTQSSICGDNPAYSLVDTAITQGKISKCEKGFEHEYGASNISIIDN
jgi:hypothetical protein